VSAFSWKNSHHVEGADLPSAIAGLTTDREGEIRVRGSTVLIKSLAEQDLVDEYRLAVYPIVLGTGKKLFSGGFPVSQFDLAESHALQSGVVVNTYRRTR
jgi:dihydrofolate reductase